MTDDHTFLDLMVTPKADLIISAMESAVLKQGSTIRYSLESYVPIRKLAGEGQGNM